MELSEDGIHSALDCVHMYLSIWHFIFSFTLNIVISNSILVFSLFGILLKGEKERKNHSFSSSGVHNFEILQNTSRHAIILSY